MTLEPLTPQATVTYMINQKCYLNIDTYENLFGIGASDGNVLHGAILMKANGIECSLIHLYTDGTALVGSILYGAAWRAAKALGYKTVTI